MMIDDGNPPAEPTPRANLNEVSSEPDAGVDETSTDPPTKARSLRWPVLATGACIVLLAVVMNWPLIYVETSISGSDSLDFDLPYPSTHLPVMAGWPYRFQISNAATDPAAAQSHFSIAALLRNIGLTLVVTALACFYVYRRERSIARSGRKRTRLSIGDLLVMTIIIALPFAVWQSIQTRAAAQAELDGELDRLGVKTWRSAWVPAVLHDWIPSSTLKNLRRVRAVRLENPTDPAVKLAASLPTLISFRVGGSGYDLRNLRPLAGALHLTDLRIAGRELDGETIALTASKSKLLSLNLSRTNVNTEAVLALDSLDNLRSLDLTHTEVRLADLGQPGWADSIELLRLPHPDVGGDDQLTLHRWPSLKHLAINELDTQVNSTTMKVDLADLPRLETLELDVFQKLDLQLKNLPELQQILPQQANWDGRLPSGGSVPGAVWLERFHGEGLPKLRQFEFFCVDLKSYLLKGETKITDLGVGVFYRSQSRQSAYERSLPQEAASALIEGIGASHGPDTIDLDAVPLQGVDLGPLRNNRQLKRLYLANSGITLTELKSLEGMDWLTELRLSGNAVDGQDISWLLKHFPELQTLEYGFSLSSLFNLSGPTGVTIHSTGPRNIEYVGHAKLKSIKRNDEGFDFINAIKVIDMPSLSVAIEAHDAQSIEIRNAPNLTGVSINSPLTRIVHIDPLKKLEMFAAGGPGINDQVVQAFSQSERLNTLTLAYPNVSKSELMKLPLTQVQRLYLPGSAVDDEVVAAWPDLEHLAHLDLSDTRITAASLPKLLASPYLRSISLDRCQLQPADLKPLEAFTQLNTLSLNGVGILPETLKAVLTNGTLNELYLSGTTLDSEMLVALQNHSQSLRFAELRECSFDATQLMQLLRNNRRVTLDVTGSEIPIELETILLQAKRQMTWQEWREHVFGLLQQQAYMTGQTDTLKRPEIESVIPIRNFVPETRATQAGGVDFEGGAGDPSP